MSDVADRSDLTRMRLVVAAPDRLLLDAPAAAIRAEGPDGCFGLLPRGQDMVAALVPGVLSLRAADGSERFVGHDEGVLVKTGTLVRVTTRRGAVGERLEEMRRQVELVFLALDEHERASRAALARLEVGVARRLLEMRQDGGGGL